MSTSLPVVPPQALDNSIIESHGRCPRKGFYSYWLRRAPTGISYPIEWGNAYHKFREVLDAKYLIEGEHEPEHWNDASEQALEIYPGDPPVGHRKDWMTVERLKETLAQGYSKFLREKNEGKFIVIATEQPFNVELPFEDPATGAPATYGGRIDQLFEWNGRLWIRDFKTTSRMGKTYPQKFDPNNQMTGYMWGAEILSGRKIAGILIETIYNTKTKGPKHEPLIVQRTQGQIDQWLNTIRAEIASIRRHEEMNIWPMRTLACNDFYGCPFREACKQSHWHSIDDWLENNTIESHWDFMDPEAEEGLID